MLSGKQPLLQFVQGVPVFSCRNLLRALEQRDYRVLPIAPQHKSSRPQVRRLQISPKARRQLKEVAKEKLFSRSNYIKCPTKSILFVILKL